MGIIKRATTLDLMSLSLLREMHSPDLADLVEHFLEFTGKLSGRKRGTSVEDLCGLIRAYREPHGQNIEELQVADLADELQEFIAKFGESPYTILAAEPGCSREDLRSAYRAKVQEWHPDQLERMAPELKAFATEQLARINAAYEELSSHE